MYRYKDADGTTKKVNCVVGYRGCGPADNIETKDVLEN
jgi:hypothetical protein